MSGVGWLRYVRLVKRRCAGISEGNGRRGLSRGPIRRWLTCYSTTRMHARFGRDVPKYAAMAESTSLMDATERFAS